MSSLVTQQNKELLWGRWPAYQPPPGLAAVLYRKGAGPPTSLRPGLAAVLYRKGAGPPTSLRPGLAAVLYRKLYKPSVVYII